MKKDLEEEHKPIFCTHYTEFKSKYTFEMGSKWHQPDPTVNLPATYKDIKQNMQQWVLSSPKSSQRIDNGIFSSFYDMKSVIKLDT